MSEDGVSNLTIKEYEEASDLFQRGFDLVFNVVRGFLYANGLLLGILTLSTRPEGGGLKFLLAPLCVIGFIGSLMTLVVHERMTKYLRLWLERASQLEATLGGKLFTSTYQIELNGRRLLLQSRNASWLLYLMFAAAWVWIYFVARPLTMP